MNECVLRAVLDSCMSIVEESPEAAKLVEAHNQAVKEVYGKVDMATFRHFENAIWEATVIFGHEMFRQGIELGRNPAMIFELPDVETGLGN